MFNELKTHNIDYRVLNFIDLDVTILCRINDKEKLIELLIANGYMQVVHPICKANGFTFGYCLSEFLLFEKKHKIEVFFQIPCFSLTPKYIIPLDLYIQGIAWDEYMSVDDVKYAIDEVRLIYYISVCIFKKKKFDINTVNWIKEHKKIDMVLLEKMLAKVFFKFTPKLLELIALCKYEEIYDSYLNYKEY